MDPRSARPSTTTTTPSASNPFPSPSPSLSVAHVPGAVVPNIPVDVVSADGINGYNTALVTELLRHKRKARDVKSCFPCRHRKVRCDGGLPCSNCVKRDHVSLCRRVTTTPGAPSSVTTTKSTVTKRISPSVAATSPRSVGSGDPYSTGSNGFATFDPTTTGQQQQQQQQQHNGYHDNSSPDVGVNGWCVGDFVFLFCTHAHTHIC